MPAKLPILPKCRHYKPKNLAVVRINGKDHYLGTYDSEESKEKYRRLLAELLTAVTPVPALAASEDAGDRLTLTELMIAYWDRHVVSYYLKDGAPTSEQDTIRQALRFARQLYGNTPAIAFSPLALKAVRTAMIEHPITRKMHVRDPNTGETLVVERVLRRGLARPFINKQISRVRRMFAWAAQEELLPLSVYQDLMNVDGLREGRSKAREKPPVGPVPEEHIEAVLGQVSPTVATMIRVQRLTAMRPPEVILLRAMDIDRSDPVCWLYRPHRYKSAHHDRERVIFLGPQCQELLRPYLELDSSGYMFSPKLAEAERRARKQTGQERPPSAATVVRQPKAPPQRTPGDLYDGGAYRKAIRRACVRLALPIWFPHQLRHNAASEIRRRYGLEASQAVLGHAELGTTQSYAAADLEKARRVMAEIG